jgi:hypothetical protein
MRENAVMPESTAQGDGERRPSGAFGVPTLTDSD